MSKNEETNETILDTEVYQDLTKDQIKQMISWRRESVEAKRDRLKRFESNRSLLEYYVTNQEGLKKSINELSFTYKETKDGAVGIMTIKSGSSEHKYKFPVSDTLFDSMFAPNVNNIVQVQIMAVNELKQEIAKREAEIDHLSSKQSIDIELFDIDDDLAKAEESFDDI